ncbi:hypothetical protein OF364_01190 [Mycoplasma enhydrae]|uniref:hypothetical protein n=1 Tax=Mycoplasma enhydrae TaxID=2499220 RepID=UPI0021E84A58|nr:hypothetical protein [Mycoplasma enhydrae]MCV3733595.1 hypothetical protein [Mycoplasma enhydrae]MCV3753429.1 hypothetical protein [Mycoplasma enhydrae]
MKKSLKILTTLGAISAMVPVSLAAISCSNTEKNELEKTISELEQKLSASDLRQDQKDALKTEIQKAKEILNNKSASKEDLVKAKTNLKSKFEEIKKQPAPKTEAELLQEAKNALSAYIKEIEAKKDTLRADQKADLEKAIEKAKTIENKADATKEELISAKNELKSSYETILAKPKPNNPRDIAIESFNASKQAIEEYIKSDLKYTYLEALKTELSQEIQTQTNIVQNNASTKEQIDEAKQNLTKKFDEIKSKIPNLKLQEAQKVVNKLAFNTNKFASEITNDNLNEQLLYVMAEGSTGSWKDFKDNDKTTEFSEKILEDLGLSLNKVNDKLYSVEWKKDTKTLEAEITIENKKFKVSGTLAFDAPNVEEYFTVLNPTIKADIDKTTLTAKKLNYKSFDFAKKGFIYEGDATKPQFIKFYTIKNITTDENAAEGKAVIEFVFSNYDNSIKYSKTVEYDGFKKGSTKVTNDSILEKIKNKTIFSGKLEQSVIDDIKKLSEDKKKHKDYEYEYFGYIKSYSTSITYGLKSKDAKSKFTGIKWDEEFIEALYTKKIIYASKSSNKRKALEFALKDNKIYIVFIFADDDTKTPHFIALED